MRARTQIFDKKTSVKHHTRTKPTSLTSAWALERQHACGRRFDAHFAAEFRDRSPGAAVMRGGPEPAERRKMLRHAIALVALEAVAGVHRADACHQPVARDLGDDRGCGNGEQERVAADDSAALAVDVDAVAAIDENELGFYRKRRYRTRERPERSLPDIVAIDACGRTKGNGDFGAGNDFQIKLFALVVGEFL